MSQAIHYISQDSETVAIPKSALSLVIEDVLDKDALLTAMDKSLSFPEYFAHNWDSAWDCLTDSDAEHLRIDLTEVQKINTEDFNVFISMVEEAFRDFGQPQLWVLVLNNDL